MIVLFALWWLFYSVFAVIIEICFEFFFLCKMLYFFIFLLKKLAQTLKFWDF